MSEIVKKEVEKKVVVVRKTVEPKKVEVSIEKPIIKNPEVKATMNFAEFKMKLTPEWAAALKVFAHVKHDMDEKSKEEWEKLYKDMLKS